MRDIFSATSGLVISFDVSLISSLDLRSLLMEEMVYVVSFSSMRACDTSTFIHDTQYLKLQK